MNELVLKFTNLRTNEIYPLQKRKLLIGSAENCDVVLNDETISHYHCMIILNSHGGEIIDLQSINGSMINNEKIEKGNFYPGDQIQLGNLIFSCLEDLTGTIEEVDINISKVESQFVPIVEAKEGLVLIDDEYCDIVFAETEAPSLSSLPTELVEFNNKDFIELEETDTSFDLISPLDENAVYISTLSNGIILSADYFLIKNNTINLSSKFKKNSIFAPFVPENEVVPFVTISNGKACIHENDQFISNKEDYTKSLELNEKVVLTYNTFQIIVEFKKAPSNLKSLPFMIRDREFVKQAGKVFAGIFLPMLFLLLVDFTIEKPPVEEIAIIYKKKIESDSKNNELSKSKPDKKNTDGHKANKQDTKKVQFSKKGEQQKSKVVEKPVVAKAEPKKGIKQKAVKAYKFNMANNVNAIFTNVGEVSVSNDRKVASVSTTSASVNTANTKIGTQVGEIGTMGSDSYGSASGSFGAKGLSSKSGFDSSYSNTKTVVLGSIDPELLRKILREYLPQFRHCYQQELMANEKIQGIVDLNFRITKIGRATDINVFSKKSAFSAQGKGCMAKVLSIIDFPKPKGGGVVDVRQPLNFFSETQKG